MALDARSAAALVLADVLAGQSLNQALPATLDKVSERDRGLLQQLCYGTLRHAPKLQAILDIMLDKPLRERDRDVQGLLLCGLYQLDGMRIPDHAAVSATVAATRTLKKPWAKGMTNAVLRRYQREAQQLNAALDPAAAACHPPWLHRKLLRQWPEQAADIFTANNQQPPMTLRLNTGKMTREDYLQQLAEQGIGAKPGSLSPQAIILDQAPRCTATARVHCRPGQCAGRGGATGSTPAAGDARRTRAGRLRRPGGQSLPRAGAAARTAAAGSHGCR